MMAVPTGPPVDWKNPKMKYTNSMTVLPRIGDWCSKSIQMSKIIPIRQMPDPHRPIARMVVGRYVSPNRPDTNEPAGVGKGTIAGKRLQIFS